MEKKKKKKKTNTNESKTNISTGWLRIWEKITKIDAKDSAQKQDLKEGYFLHILVLNCVLCPSLKH